MGARDVLSRFDEEMRRNPPELKVYQVERQPNLTRLVAGSEAFVLWTRAAPDDFPGLIQAEISAARAHERSLEWKVYSHDNLPSLSVALQVAGLRPRPHETLMIRDLQQGMFEPRSIPGLEIRTIRDADGFRDYVRVDQAAFGSQDDARYEETRERLHDPQVAIYLAYLAGVPACSGRVEFESGRSFAGLFGGGTVPPLRGRGIYKELVRARLEWARDHGARWAFVEAVDTTSRPILERLGFEAVAGIEAWCWDPALRARES
jgi:GNAT superfamily N-acetyltransferase